MITHVERSADNEDVPLNLAIDGEIATLYHDIGLKILRCLDRLVAIERQRLQPAL